MKRIMQQCLIKHTNLVSNDQNASSESSDIDDDCPLLASKALDCMSRCRHQNYIREYCKDCGFMSDTESESDGDSDDEDQYIGNIEMDAFMAWWCG